MRSRAILFLLLAGWFTVSAQCKIECFGKQKAGGPTTGPKGFILILDNFTNDSTAVKFLVSDNLGIINMDSTFYLKVKDRIVVGFDFKDDLNREYYRRPVEFDSHISISQLCGKRLIAEARF